MVTTKLLTAGIWPAIKSAARTAIGQKHAAIAYIGADSPLETFQKGDVLVCNASDRALQSGATNPLALAALLRREVYVASDDNLHAKILVWRNSLFVGSMNASHNSTNRLVEAAIQTDERALVDQARAFVLERYATSSKVNDKFIKRAKRYYRPSANDSVSVGAESAPRRPTRVLVYEYEQRDWPKAVAARYDKLEQTWQRQAGPPARWSIDITWDDDREWIRKDDWIVWIDSESTDHKVFPPAKVLDREPAGGRSNQIITCFRAPENLETIPWRQFYLALPAAGRRQIDASQLVTDVPTIDTIFAQWGLSPDD